MNQFNLVGGSFITFLDELEGFSIMLISNHSMLLETCYRDTIVNITREGAVVVIVSTEHIPLQSLEPLSFTMMCHEGTVLCL